MEISLQELLKWDIITPIAHQMGPNGFYFRQDGRIDADRFMQPTSPWIHVNRSWNRECGFWHAIWFSCYGILPSPCLECWKVVVRPRTIKELFQLLELQENCTIPCKCGIEKRGFVEGNYGGYFYGDSHRQGMDNYNAVREMVSEGISPDVNVILKRGCTEFEMKFGDSREWDRRITPQQKELENILNNAFVRDESHVEQPKILKSHIIMRWMKRAHDVGDGTYREFTGGASLPGVVNYVTYHDKGVKLPDTVGD